MNALLDPSWVAANLGRLGWTLVHFLWQGTLAAGFLAVELAALRRAPARWRYLAGVAAVAAALLMSAVTFGMLRPVTVMEATAWNAPAVRGTVTTKGGERPADFVGLARPAPVSGSASLPVRATLREQGRADSRWTRRVSDFAARLQVVSPWLGAGWTLGVCILSVRLMVGWKRAQRLRRRGVQALDDLWRARMESLACGMGVRRVVRLLGSTVVEVPAVLGVLRPVVLLPVGILAGLSVAQVEMILAHELAHIRRQDYLVNLGLNLFETLGFYHPAVWWIAARVREEREHACDDLAVQATGGDPLGYARALATLEELRPPLSGVALAATSGGAGTLLARVRRLLGATTATPPRRGHATGWLAGTLALVIASALILTGLRRPAQAREPGNPPPAPATSPTATPVNPNELTGRVVDEVGKPVADALFYDDESHEGSTVFPPGPIHTDTDGTFRLPKLKYPRQWRFVGARLGEESVGWLDIGAGRQPAAFGADNVLTRPIVLRPRRYAVQGVCVDEGGQPVAGATIAVTALPTEGSGYFNWQSNHPEDATYHFWEALTARSDAEGKFSLPVPLPEGMLVEIRAEGRQSLYPFNTRKAGVWPKLDLGRVTLVGAGSIAGQIVFAPRPGDEPRPLKEAFLVAVNAADAGAATLLGPTEYDGVPYSDGQGRYRIEHLPPGTYTVYLNGLGHESPDQPLPRMAAVEDVVVRAGQTTPLDLRAVLGRHLPVRAVDPDTNQPVSDLPVHFVGPSRPASSGLNTGSWLSRGEWTFLVAPGHYRVSASEKPGPNSPELASAEVDVPADRDADPVILEVKTGGSHLRGKVQDAQGKFIPLTGGSTVLLLETYPTPGKRQGARRSSDGSFDIVLDKTGTRAWLAVDVPGFRPFLSPEFAVADQPEPVTVTLEPAPDFVIRGRALDQDGQPVAHGDVTGTIFPAEGLSYPVSLGTGIPEEELYTDQDGRFETHRIRAGAKFRLDVFAGGRRVAASSAWTQLGQGDKPGWFNVEMNAVPFVRASVPDVPVGPRDLAGHVVDAQGKPVEGVVVVTDGTSSFSDPGGTITNAAGGFRFPDFGDRNYVYLSASKEGYATHWVTDLSVGKDFSVPLQNGTRLRGQFTLADASPAGRTHIVLRTSRPTARPFMSNPIRNLRLDRDTDERGAYDFPVEPSEYSAEITSADGRLVARYERIEVKEGQATALPAMLNPGLPLRLQTVDRETGQPVAGLKFFIYEYTDTFGLGIKPGSERVTDAQGFAIWENLTLGLVELSKDQTGVYQRLWSVDPRDESPLNPPTGKVPTGSEGTYFQVVLRLVPERSGEPVVVQVERGVKVFGEVRDAGGQPAINVSVSALADRPAPPGGTRPELEGLGSFNQYEQEGVFSGYIAAGNGVPSFLTARPQDEGQGVTHSEPFDSQPGDERQFTLRLNRGGIVEGTVLDRQGRPLPNVNVSGLPLDGLDRKDLTPWAKTDAQGRFRCEHIRPTEYEFTTTVVPHMSVGSEPPQERRRVIVPAGEKAEVGVLHFDPAGWTEAHSPSEAQP